MIARLLIHRDREKMRLHIILLFLDNHELSQSMQQIVTGVTFTVFVEIKYDEDAQRLWTFILEGTFKKDMYWCWSVPAIQICVISMSMVVKEMFDASINRFLFLCIDDRRRIWVVRS